MDDNAAAWLTTSSTTFDDKFTDKPDDKSIDKSDDKSHFKSDDKSDDKSNGKSDDKPNDKADDKSNDKSNDKPDDKSSDKSTWDHDGSLSKLLDKQERSGDPERVSAPALRARAAG